MRRLVKVALLSPSRANSAAFTSATQYEIEETDSFERRTDMVVWGRTMELKEECSWGL